MKTLQELVPSINNAELRLIWREVEGLLPKKLKFIDFEDKETDNMDATYVGGHNEAVAEAVTALRDFIKGDTEQ